MRQAVTMLVVFLIALLGSGCSVGAQPCVDDIVFIPQKCVVPSRDYPEIETMKFEVGNELAQSKQAYKNYLKLKEYTELLKGDLSVCR